MYIYVYNNFMLKNWNEKLFYNYEIIFLFKFYIMLLLLTFTWQHMDIISKSNVTQSKIE